MKLTLPVLGASACASNHQPYTSRAMNPNACSRAHLHRPPHACAIALAAFALSLTASNARAQPDYPLTPSTGWTYHMRQEVGPGVAFSDADAALANGNVLEATIVARVAGSDMIGGDEYARIESTRAGRPWLTEWYRLAPEGLLLGQTFDADTGQAIEMIPPQRLLSPTLAAGESWTWEPPDAPVAIATHVAGPVRVSVPAGEFQATKIESETMIDTGGGLIKVRQGRWFVPRIGYVRQETETIADDRLINKVALDLEQFDARE